MVIDVQSFQLGDCRHIFLKSVGREALTLRAPQPSQEECKWRLPGAGRWQQLVPSWPFPPSADWKRMPAHSNAKIRTCRGSCILCTACVGRMRACVMLQPLFMMLRPSQNMYHGGCFGKLCDRVAGGHHRQCLFLKCVHLMRCTIFVTRKAACAETHRCSCIRDCFLTLRRSHLRSRRCCSCNAR